MIIVRIHDSSNSSSSSSSSNTNNNKDLMTSCVYADHEDLTLALLYVYALLQVVLVAFCNLAFVYFNIASCTLYLGYPIMYANLLHYTTALVECNVCQSTPYTTVLLYTRLYSCHDLFGITPIVISLSLYIYIYT